MGLTMIRADPSALTEKITVLEAHNTRLMIQSWLLELEHTGRLEAQKVYESYELFDKLQTSIWFDNCDCFGKLAVHELSPNGLSIFKTIIFWANETCPEHF